MSTNELPTSEMGRYITFHEISRTTQTPAPTVMSWHRYLRAVGLSLGAKFKGVWNFSPHEFFQLNLAGALSRAGFPVDIEVLRQLVEATRLPGRPEKPIFIKTASTFAIVAVDAPAVWDAAAHMLARAESNANAQ